MPLFTPAELASYMRRSTADLGNVDLHIELAEGLILPLIGGAASPLITDIRIKATGIEVVARALRNPEGYIAESLDDWSGRLPETAARAGVFLTRDERSDLISLATPGSGGHARSVQLVADSTRPRLYRLPTP